MPTKKWTEEEEEFLKTNYISLSNADLAERYDITKNAVQKKLARMGLKRSQVVEEPPLDETAEIEPVEEEHEVINVESHFFVGNRLFHQEREYEQAIAEYRQVAREKSDKLTKFKARYWMAESYVKIGEIKKAMRILKKLSKDSKNTYLGDSAGRRAESLADYIIPPHVSS